MYISLTINTNNIHIMTQTTNLDTVPTRVQLEQAIKAQRWDRSSYEYALNAMLPYRCFNDSSIYKKAELIELFYTIVPTKWNCIKGFTTFKHLI